MLLRDLLNARVTASSCRRRSLACTVLMCMATALPSPAIGEVSFSREVQPLLAKRCFSCHGPDLSESGLALHDGKLALAPTDSGAPAIVPGDPDDSLLTQRIMSTDEGERMPPEGDALSEAEVALLRDWIAEGAKFDSHWAFKDPIEQMPPPVEDEEWSRNPIDQFISVRLAETGLQPAAEASKATLARRLYYDVIGLPPTLDEMEEFLADRRPDAYERLVDRLLASPHYGEKWARHWLDVVCYGETNSYERDAAKPNAYKYRDWVIRSFNEDKPYDQFVREQLAGDELDEVTPETMIATGYYRLGVWDDAPVDRKQAAADELDIILTTTGHAFLGLTVGCARCHDHKIDPIPQADYYRLLSFFADITRYGTKASDTVHHQWDLSSPDLKRKRSELHEVRDELKQQRTELEQQAIVRMEGVDQRRSETDKRAALLAEKLDEYQTDVERERYKELGAKLSEVELALEDLPAAEFALALAKCNPNPDAVHILERGNVHTPSDPVEPRFPEIFGGEAPQLPAVEPNARSSGRRRILADWIASTENPLTSRVIVNRVWQQHFGRGIVRSSNNFGGLGTPPTHPLLLDWLADWLVEHEWRLKPLHRLILTSSACRMDSAPNEAAAAIDPDNDLFWRFNMRRLTAEEIRDSILAVTGQLDRSLYGPSIYPRLSEEVLATQSKPGHGWDTTQEAAVPRRSIYIHIKRTLIPPELEVFDFPQPDTSCAVRFNTTQAAQAMNLLHSEFLQCHSRLLAERIRQEASSKLESQIKYALQVVLQREPIQASIDEGVALVRQFQSQHKLSADEAFRQFCLLALNLNEFVYVD